MAKNTDNRDRTSSIDSNSSTRAVIDNTEYLSDDKIIHRIDEFLRSDNGDINEFSKELAKQFYQNDENSERKIKTTILEKRLEFALELEAEARQLDDSTKITAAEGNTKNAIRNFAKNLYSNNNEKQKKFEERFTRFIENKREGDRKKTWHGKISSWIKNFIAGFDKEKVQHLNVKPQDIKLDLQILTAEPYKKSLSSLAEFMQDRDFATQYSSEYSGKKHCKSEAERIVETLLPKMNIKDKHYDKLKDLIEKIATQISDHYSKDNIQKESNRRNYDISCNDKEYIKKTKNNIENLIQEEIQKFPPDLTAKIHKQYETNQLEKLFIPSDRKVHEETLTSLANHFNITDQGLQKVFIENIINEVKSLKGLPAYCLPKLQKTIDTFRETATIQAELKEKQNAGVEGQDARRQTTSKGQGQGRIT